MSTILPLPAQFKARLGLARLFSSAILNQAVLSAASLLAGLVLIRQTQDFQYGYYVLAWTAILLVSSLQSAYFSAPMVIRMTGLDRQGRADVTGGIYREQLRAMKIGGACALLITAGVWFAGGLDAKTGPLALTVIVAALSMLHREYFRMALLAYHRPHDVLNADLVYAVMLVAGVVLAAQSPRPATVSMLVLAAAAAVGTMLLSRSLRRHEPWNIRGAPGILRSIAPIAAWSTAGAAIHWTFSQGYTFVVAALLSVDKVGEIAATRLLMTPINLLALGLGALMLPLAASWLNSHGPATVLRRLSLFAAGIVIAACLYFALLWLLRDWVFTAVLRKNFAERDALLMLWFGAFTLMAVRDQLIFLPIARERFAALTGATFVSAVVSLSLGYAAVQRLGEIGAPLGVLCGELVSVSGILMLGWREAFRERSLSSARRPAGPVASTRAA